MIITWWGENGQDGWWRTAFQNLEHSSYLIFIQWQSRLIRGSLWGCPCSRHMKLLTAGDPDILFMSLWWSWQHFYLSFDNVPFHDDHHFYLSLLIKTFTGPPLWTGHHLDSLFRIVKGTILIITIIIIPISPRHYWWERQSWSGWCSAFEHRRAHLIDLTGQADANTPGGKRCDEVCQTSCKSGWWREMPVATHHGEANA